MSGTLQLIPAIQLTPKCNGPEVSVKCASQTECEGRMTTYLNRAELAQVIADAAILDRACEVVDGKIQDCIDDIIQRRSNNLFLMAEKCESPLEILLGSHLLGICNGYDDVQFMDAWGAFGQEDWSTIFGAQVEAGPYRADFLFKTRLKESYKLLAVEVDGHDFHERTKAQARRDKQRDRWFLQNGVECLRFTGSEIFADPGKCALEVENYLHRQASDLLLAAGIYTPARRGPIT